MPTTTSSASCSSSTLLAPWKRVLPSADTSAKTPAPARLTSSFCSSAPSCPDCAAEKDPPTLGPAPSELASRARLPISPHGRRMRSGCEAPVCRSSASGWRCSSRKSTGNVGLYARAHFMAMTLKPLNFTGMPDCRHFLATLFRAVRASSAEHQPSIDISPSGRIFNTDRCRRKFTTKCALGPRASSQFKKTVLQSRSRLRAQHNFASACTCTGTPSMLQEATSLMTATRR
mmetsp:Transcript_90051/g.226579  ORF Transcript_90051/g.226579 Transcript_90051/m.226579 type:complete len:231 (+) Transcript_90051:257-949(+)